MNHPHIFETQYLLHTPIAFVLQKTTIQKVEDFYDENGWNILHHAVATADIEKIVELLHFSFNPLLNSRKNYIYTKYYNINDKKKEQKILFFDKIPFIAHGFTPIHLALFLYDYYLTLSEDFFYTNIASKYQKILEIFLSNNSFFNNCLDDFNYSLFDYAFLLENITIIDLIHMLDFNLDTLTHVHPKTAKKILEVIAIKKNDKKHDYIIELLDKKILSEELNNKLTIKTNIIKSAPQKI